MKFHVDFAKLAPLIRDAFKLAADLAKSVPNGVTQEEAALLIDDGAKLAGDIAALFIGVGQ